MLDGIAFKGSQLGKAYTMKGLTTRGLSYDPARDAGELRAMTRDSGITPSETPERSQMLNFEDTYTTGLAYATLGPSEMAFIVSRDHPDVKPIETLKAAGLEPARVVMTSDKALVVVLKVDQPLGSDAQKALSRTVWQAVPEAEPCPIPEHGMVLEAKGVAFSKALEIERSIYQEK
jgi:hypothetical protein